MDDPSHLLWTAAAAFAALAAFAGWRDHARTGRHDLDRPGLMPWSLVTVLAMLLAVVCGALGVMV